MSAGHAPHTPPVWRQVLSLPHTLVGWWAIGLAAPALFFWALRTNINDGYLSIWGVSLPSVPWVVLLIFYTWALSSLAGGLVGLIAVAHDRSLLVWVAQVPGLIAFSILFVFGREGSPWIPLLTPVLIWAVLNFGIILFSTFYHRYVDPQGETEDSR